MRILIVDQCSKAKDVPDHFEPLSAETIDSTTREQLLDEEHHPAVRARELYAGRQQRYISQAVDRLRSVGDDVDRVFISAGFGVVDEATRVPPYDVTFANYSETEIRDRASALNIPADVAALFTQNPPYDIAFFPLGEAYYLGMDLESLLEVVPDQTTVVLFNRGETEVPGRNVISVPARNGQAKQHGTIVVALKGKYLKNFAEHRSEGREFERPVDIVDACTSEVMSQSDLEDFE